MINSRILPIHIISNYCWELLSRNTSMSKIDGNVPITGINDSRVFNESDQPYLIYSFSEMESVQFPQVREGYAVFRVVSPNTSSMFEISNTISAAFEEGDTAAGSVNAWSSKNENLLGIRFTSIQHNYFDGSEPADEEGGDYEGVITLKYTYVTNLKPIVYIPTGNNTGEWA